MLAGLALAVAAAPCGARPAAAPDLHALDYAGPARALDALDRQINLAGTDTKKTAEIADQLLDQLARTDCSVAARQAICERLGRLLPPQNGISLPSSWAPLVRMLVQPENVDFARLALEPVPGAAIDAVFVDALEHPETAAATAARLHDGRDSSLSAPVTIVVRALLQSAAKRRIVGAAPVAIRLLRESDTTTAALAARVLAATATREAIGALLDSASQRADVQSALLEALANNREFAGTERALYTASQLLADRDTNAGIKGAALEYMIAHGSQAQVSELIDHWLKGVETAPANPALASGATLALPGLTERFAQALPHLDPATQAATLAMLGRRGDPVATAAVIEALKSTAPEVRLAAIQALGLLPGSRAGAAALLSVIATSDNIDDVKAAKASLARMSGGDPDAEITAAVKAATDPKLQAAAVEQLALRNVQPALPLLRELRTAADARVRSTAVTSLGDIAPSSDQSLLIAWALGATDDDERSHALRALVTLTGRIHRDDAAKPIWGALEAAPPEVAARCAPVLTRLGDVGSAVCAAHLAVHGAPVAANAAVNALARWPDVSALDAQVTVAANAPDPQVRQTAFRAALAAMDRAVDHWSAARTGEVARLAKLNPNSADAATLLQLLRRASDPTAETVAHDLGAKLGAPAAAAECVEVIQANRKHRAIVTASGGWGIMDLTDGNAATAWTIAATAGQWAQLDFGESRPIARVILDPGKRGENTAGTIEVYVTDDPARLGVALQSLVGQPRRMTIDLPPGTRGRYLIVKNATERIDGYWSVGELIVE